MGSIKLHGWDKKPRTPIRSLKVGDIFLMALSESSYAVGRILSKLDIGHGVEFFDLNLSEHEVAAGQIENAEMLAGPVIVDSYWVFDRKPDCDWRIVGHESGFSPSEGVNAYFSYGGAQYWKIDLFGNQVEISKREAEELPPYTPQRDAQIKKWLTPLLKKQ
ncbi:Imm26 family immunity protein [Burkholderia ubonensis]|uniref:Phosphotriesterase n=1 Tax=Burkholderia ubonensis subsp. mesacidophila TaxID=265293 RepID=A0A2A4FLX3_9BURK|nr:Imm26 family immunity protein [Burkholderia ubonensis]PCE34067.1 hypothetical protein BZL54_02075 [Burkholderia ubonensis subsp. mesacidophila]